MTRRETIGQRLKRVREEQGLSYAKLVRKILKDHGEVIGASTIRSIEEDVPPNPGIKTLELIALGLGLDPLEVISWGLKDPPELESDSQFARLGTAYKKVQNNKKTIADEFIKMLTEQMERWR
jgi:transcriptional regulator with XRE-family HTH domain